MAEILGMSPKIAYLIVEGLNAFATVCYERSRKSGFWTDIMTGADLTTTRNRPEMMMLMVSEIAEAMEGHRKNLQDDHLPYRKMEEVEMADAAIRIGDYCGGFNFNLGRVVLEKLAYNAQRADHKIKNRQAEGGKKF
jgi:hypothetical protein